jgi:hypothetical protein
MKPLRVSVGIGHHQKVINTAKEILHNYDMNMLS